MKLSGFPRDYGADAAAERENYRTCGRSSSHNGRHKPPKIKHGTSVPSIPARIETKLLEGQRESLGFGSVALRFDPGSNGPGSGGELPGPGEYRKPVSFTDEFLGRTSWGAKGTGGFASKSRRFGSRSLPSLPRPGMGCPGPGAYESLTSLKRVQEQRQFSQAKGTAVFAKQSEGGGTAQQVERELAPGPGYYSDVRRPQDLSHISAAQAAFRSLSRRLEGVSVGDEVTPGPGFYEASGTRSAPLTPTFRDRRRSQETANFKEPTRRRWVKRHVDLPAADERARRVLGDLAREVAHECVGSADLGSVPGPGAYHVDREALWEGRVVGALGLSSFQVGPRRHEWATDEVASVPGPGKYDPKKVIPEKLASGVAVFESVTERGREAPKVPGPAYYHPKPPPPQKSFHLNVANGWL